MVASLDFLNLIAWSWVCVKREQRRNLVSRRLIREISTAVTPQTPNTH